MITFRIDYGVVFLEYTLSLIVKNPTAQGGTFKDQKSKY